MTKREEMHDPKSCFNKATDGEFMFVLLGRDMAAPFAIRAWASERIRQSLNNANDPQILKALKMADQIERGEGVE